MSTDYTMGKEVQINRYHIPVMRSQLTRNIGALSSTIRDEIVTSLQEILALKDDGEWFIFCQHL